MEQLIIALPVELPKGLDATVAWLREYAEIADDGKVNHRGGTVKAALEAAGYVANEYTGNAFKRGDKRIMGRYIVGQALSCLDHGMSPHPITEKFCAEYFELADSDAKI